ncbi:MAG: Xaa-Pro peptidase family protein [Bacillota bacterium]
MNTQDAPFDTAQEQGIPREEVLDRQERVRRRLLQAGLDALLVVGRSFYDRVGDLAYLTNHFPPFPATVFSGQQKGLGHGLLLLPGEGPTALVIDGRAYREELVVADEVRGGSDLGAVLAELLRERRLATARIGLVGEDILPLAMFRALTQALPALELPAAGHLVRELRRRKSPAELRLLRRGAAIAGAGLKVAVELIGTVGHTPGASGTGATVTESDVCAAGIAAAMREGADFIRYLRVHSGPYSAWGSRWPQAMPRAIRVGELVDLDIIGAYWGYQFDVLRTTVAGGRPDAGQRRVLEAVLEASRRAVAACRPGTPCEDVVRVANAYLEEQGYGRYARTFMGHGIGLETVEEPYLAPGDRTPLEPGMVLCVEPGVYIPGWGGASIEEEIIVTGGAPEQITHYPAKLWAGP